MTIDPKNPPTEVWHINRERVRKGWGIQKLNPERSSWHHNALYSAFRIKGRRGAYWAEECYATEAEAREAGQKFLRILMRDERTRHAGITERLTAAQVALEGEKA
jgi:hypothetical protein